MSREKPIRRGDVVRIVNPEIFVRCGYPIDYKEESQRIAEEKKLEIELFFHALGLGTPTEEEIKRVANAVTYSSLQHKRFGGNERKIYTKRDPELEGLVAEVTDVRLVKTGVRVPGRFYSGGYWGEDEYEPPFLDEVKTHRILTLDYAIFGCIGRSIQFVEIEDCHVERHVFEPPPQPEPEPELHERPGPVIMFMVEPEPPPPLEFAWYEEGF